jgi:heme-degrading monooxygenase HmoA
MAGSPSCPAPATAALTPASSSTSSLNRETGPADDRLHLERSRQHRRCRPVRRVHPRAGFAEYGRTRGNRGAWLLRRDHAGTTEFITLSLWDTIDAIHAFAGENIEAAVLYPEDERYLIDGQSHITHYDVADHIPYRPD